MKALVVDSDSAQLARTLTTLQPLLGDVRAAAGDREARELLLHSLPQLVLVDVSRAAADGLSLIRHIRGLTTPHYVYVLAVGKLEQEDEIDDAYEAGCDGELHAPVNLGHFRARLRSAERRLGIAPPAKTAVSGAKKDAPPQKAVAAPAKPTPASDSPIGVAVRSGTWRTMDVEMAAMVSRFLGLDVAVGEIDPARIPILSSRISLSNVEHELDVEVGLGTDRESAAALAMQLFGEDSPDMQADMLSELANMAMGTLKTSFSKETLPFTGSLPEMLQPDRFQHIGAASTCHRAFSLQAKGGARIGFRIGMRSTQNIVVTATGLHEGMVIAKDVFNANGMLLLAAGTRLSSTTADRLRKALGPKHAIAIAAH